MPCHLDSYLTVKELARPISCRTPYDKHPTRLVKEKLQRLPSRQFACSSRGPPFINSTSLPLQGIFSGLLSPVDTAVVTGEAIITDFQLIRT
jgi:hypothetical protein